MNQTKFNDGVPLSNVWTSVQGLSGDFPTLVNPRTWMQYDQELERVQKRAFSIISSGQDYHEILEAAGIPPIMAYMEDSCRNLFSNIIENDNHRLRELLPSANHPKHNLRRMASQDMSNEREELELTLKFPGAAVGALKIIKQVQLSSKRRATTSRRETTTYLKALSKYAARITESVPLMVMDYQRQSLLSSSSFTPSEADLIYTEGGSEE
ncbi:hypothetical protein pdam_00023368 [Pocillopora damicornis]|uniref:Uncharacterized protein n=1 Tax=Pocillopora damicornis TaxID=46731 RepID=A0A3M6TTQ1_POCDA|nr:hypothetical protein pdam_00023368 [Pocillopora damicornis]